MDATFSRKQLIISFWIAVILSFSLAHIPYGNWVLYPFAILSTWAHEMGHGLTALLMGGDFKYLEIYQNLGGVAYFTRHNDIAMAAISAGGLLGPAIAGGIIIILGSTVKTSRWVLKILAVLLILSALIWVRNLFGFCIILALGLTLGLIGFYGGEILELSIVQFIGIRFCLESLLDIDYMFTKEFVRNGVVMKSDSQNIAEALLFPYWFWGLIIAVLSIVILLLAFYFSWFRDSKRTR